MTTTTQIGTLFSPTAIGRMRLRNRVAMAPMTRRFAGADRVPTDAMREYYARRARHGVGLIITEGTVTDATSAPPKRKPDAPGFVPGIYSNEQVEGWKRVTGDVHEAGGAIAIQLWHTGRFGGERAVAPSAWRSEDGEYDARAMTEDDLARTMEDFAASAANARSAGFDAVEIHGAHGYLLHSFLDPQINTRTDEFGGSFENRMRYPLGILRAVRDGAGEGFPIIVRFSQWSVEDYGRTIFADAGEVSTFAMALKAAGADALHPSTRDATAPAFDGSDETLAAITKRATGLPTIAVGRVTTSQTFGNSKPLESTDPSPAIELIERGDADVLAVGRALIANADWCEKVRDGKWDELRAFEVGMLGTLE